MNELMIDGQRLWRSLEGFAEIGATPRGGVCRIALTDADRRARDLFAELSKAAGCTVRVDQMGNIFARREGTDPSRPPILTGSHIDSQPTGGRFDGIYGVLAGLEVLRTLEETATHTAAPIEVAVWTNEEGSRFAPAMVASGVFAGAFTLDYGLSRTDPNGQTLGQALEDIGYAGTEVVGGRPLGAVIEAHIEQGPILEEEGRTIGVVTGAQGQRWYEIRLQGFEAHAGTTPMALRKDALVGAAEAVLAIEAIAAANNPLARGTVGVLKPTPNSRNTVPGEVFFTADLRHPDEDTLAGMDRALRGFMAGLSKRRNLEAVVEEIWHSPAIVFDGVCVDAVRRAAERRRFAHRDIVSGAGHDACYLARVAPTAMIFIPCKGGVSHNETESATPEDASAGAQILLDVMLELAA